MLMIKNRFAKGITAAGLGLGIALTSVLTAGAQELPDAAGELARRGFIGTVTSYDGSTLVIDPVRAESEDVTFKVDDGTTIRMPGGPEVAGALEKGARVGVLGLLEEDGTWVAMQILVKPLRPSVQAITGAVVERDGRTLTIQLPNGETRVIHLGEDDDVPEPGEVVTAFERRPQFAGQKPEVTGLARASEVRARLEGFLADVVENRPGLPDAVQQSRNRIAERLTTLLEEHAERHSQLLERVLNNTRIPENARARIQQALQDSERGAQRVREAVENARDRLGLPERGPGNRPAGRP